MAGAETTSARDNRLNELLISIQSRFEGLSPPSNCCIFTVPEKLRQTNKEAYPPSVVAIGPYHRLNPNLMQMEDHKLLYLQNFLQHNQNYCLKDYIQRVMSWEDDAWKCYDKQIDLDFNQFTKMILLDSIFMIQLFLMYSDPQRRLPSNWIFSRPWMFMDVRDNMILLENQIPFFVIQRLFEMAFGTHWQHTPELLELVCCFFKPFMRMEMLPESVTESEVTHFIHAISLTFLSSVRKAPNESNEESKLTPSAMELVAAGVKLRRRESKCLFDIEFENGVLNIPCLTLEDTTESYFRNIMASNSYLTDYMDFMHHLVDIPGDVELLINKGIIENWLSNKEAVARVINALADYYFYSLSDKLIKHCQKPHNKWKATFKRDYCSSPWVVNSVIAAEVDFTDYSTDRVLSPLSCITFAF
ncbi:hypothetical protein BT93_C0877 [Corymbia citriodora subsp. variegata]|nr:hypothetical protein BT93_C0877 [Corymbia citriodora subsp. variegata]